MKVIALKGGKHNGKSHVASIIKSKIKNVSIASFGAHLKEVGSLMFGFTDDQLNGSKKEVEDDEWAIVPREWMQWFATEIMREEMPKRFGKYGKLHGETYWARFVINKIIWKHNYCPDGVVVIDDLRFKADDMAVRAHCNSRGIEYKVFDVQRVGVQSTDAHRSETELVEIESNGIIHNDTHLTDQELIEHIRSVTGV